ncbi:MAG: LysM peptidoglycan-binding domain-containing protein [Phycisphaerales bacterium]|nr:LysM peptidoglycan-binding domain-containing protein [Phycisphaerales bacterium]
MEERSSKIFVGLCLLVLVWIGVYWMWEPERDDRPRITFAAQPEVAVDPRKVEPEPEPEPEIEPELILPEPEKVEVARVITHLGERGNPGELIAPEFTEYTVLDGENMGSIARKIFGSSERWDAISRSNPRVDPKKIRVGQVLRIPVDPDNVQGKLVISSDTESERERPSKVVEYFIQSGDSLSRIAERFYGSSRHATMIYEYNRDVLSSMDDIGIGDLLRLPPLDETDDDGG